MAETVRTVEELLTFGAVGGGSAGTPNVSNKNMAVNTTTGDDQLATATAIAATPIGFVGVGVNGVTYNPTNKSGTCYFSPDGGTTVHAPGAVVAGDQLFWVGSVAGFQLSATTDAMSFYYDS